MPEIVEIETSPDHQPEKIWLFQVLLGELLQVNYVVRFADGLTKHRLCLPNGKVLMLEDHFFHLLEEESGPENLTRPTQTAWLDHPFQPGTNLVVLYGFPEVRIQETQIECRADLLAATFYMLSRWEEYGQENRGRFPAERALACRDGFIQRPVVNEYAAFLSDCLTWLGFPVPYPVRPFRLHLSCDVDHLKLWTRPADRLRTLAGSLLLRRSAPEFLFWLGGPLWRRDDPFNVFDEWMALAESNNLRWQFNFMAGREETTDCSYSLNDPFFQQVIASVLGRGHSIGFHPSRRAHGDFDAFRREFDALQRSVPDPIKSGRQHYLHFRIPDTWHFWSEIGADWESSMGYAEREGFRCGICQDFPVFNLVSRKQERIREKPLQIMDVTLLKYRNLNPERAGQHILELRRTIERHGGEMVVLWHNSSWNDYIWGPWRKILLNLVGDLK